MKIFYDLTQGLCHKYNWSARIPKIFKKSQNTAHSIHANFSSNITYLFTDTHCH